MLSSLDHRIKEKECSIVHKNSLTWFLIPNFSGKTIILIDDSIVRGTTIGQLVRMLKDAGAVDVHIRIASPPLHYPCYMGINIPTRDELIANHLNADQLATSLGTNLNQSLIDRCEKNSLQIQLSYSLFQELSHWSIFRLMDLSTRFNWE